MIKYYILAGIFIIKLQYFTSTISWSDGSHPQLWVIEKLTLRRKLGVCVCEWTSREWVTMHGDSPNFCLPFSLALFTPASGCLCICLWVGLGLELSVRKSFWGRNRNLIKPILVSW